MTTHMSTAHDYTHTSTAHDYTHEYRTGIHDYTHTHTHEYRTWLRIRVPHMNTWVTFTHGSHTAYMHSRMSHRHPRGLTPTLIP